MSLKKELRFPLQVLRYFEVLFSHFKKCSNDLSYLENAWTVVVQQQLAFSIEFLHVVLSVLLLWNTTSLRIGLTFRGGSFLKLRGSSRY